MSTRQPPRPPAAPHPQRAPVLHGGTCTEPRYDPEIWHHTASRQLALALCARCPLLAPCQAWATTVPAADSAVIGALTPADRAAIRRERQRVLAAVMAPRPAA